MIRRQRQISERGSVSEFVLAFPVILFITLAAIDFSRYLVFKGLAEASAERALSLATVIPDLEDETKVSGSTQKGYEKALEDVTDKAKQMLQSSGTSVEMSLKQVFADQQEGVSRKETGDCSYKGACLRKLEFKLPEVPPGNTLRNVLINEPMILTMETQFKPILGFFGPITIEVNAAAYREIRLNSTLPLGETCRQVNGICECPNNPKKQVLDGHCVCKEGLVADDTKEGGCDCLYGEWNSALGRCKCSDCPAPPDGGIPYALNESNCFCGCGQNAVDDNGVCKCKTNYAETSSGNCACDLNAAKCAAQGKIFDSSKCQCICDPATHNECDDGRCHLKTACNNISGQQQNLEFDKKTCSCRCKQGFDYCGTNSKLCYYNVQNCGSRGWDREYCGCKACPEGQQPCGSGATASCIDCPCGKIVKNINGSCQCVDAAPGDVPTDRCSDGSCTHHYCGYYGMEFYADSPYCRNGSYDCRCGEGKVQCYNWYDDNECWDPTCTVPGQTFDGGDGQCKCRCPDGQEFCDGECRQVSCPSNQIANKDGCGCKCPDNLPRKCGDTCYSNCPAYYNDKQQYQGGMQRYEESCETCSCPPGTVHRQLGVYNYCLPATCTGGKEWIPNTSSNWTQWTCKCPSSKPWDCGGQCRAECPGGSGQRCAANGCTCISAPTGNEPAQKCGTACLSGVECNGSCYGACPVTGQSRSAQNNCECRCGANQHVCTAQNKCVPDCPPGQVEVNCQCQCPNNGFKCKLNGQEECKADDCDGEKIPDPNNCNACKCPPKTCTGGQVQDPDSCECKCPGDGVLCNGQCRPKLPAGQVYDASCNAGCASQLDKACVKTGGEMVCVRCYGGTAPDPANNCQCSKCPSDQVLCSGQCHTACPIAGAKRLESNNCECACEPGESELLCKITGTKICRPEGCDDPEKIYDEDTCGCICKESPAVLLGKKCVIPGGAYHTINPETCQCECTGGAVPGGGGAGNEFKDGKLNCIWVDPRCQGGDLTRCVLTGDNKFVCREGRC